MSRINVLWLPIPKPKSMTQALLMSKLSDTHNPSIGLDPQKNVAPGQDPVWCTIASRRPNFAFSASSLPSCPLRICSLWSMKSMIWSPPACHSWICFVKYFRNRTLGNVRSFFFVMK
jgi:hypothetical protein